MRHQNVWYRSAPKQSRWRPIRAHEDTINPWITIEDRDGNRVLFADGSRFGWGGVRGGTVKLVDEIEKALGAKAT